MFHEVDIVRVIDYDAREKLYRKCSFGRIVAFSMLFPTSPMALIYFISVYLVYLSETFSLDGLLLLRKPHVDFIEPYHPLRSSCFQNNGRFDRYTYG